MNRFFHTAPLAPATWLVVLGAGLVLYSVVGGEKWLRRRWARTSPADRAS
jgi:hypothetical protein